MQKEFSEEEKVKEILFKRFSEGLSFPEVQKLVYSLLLEETKKAFEKLGEDQKKEMAKSFDKAYNASLVEEED